MELHRLHAQFHDCIQSTVRRMDRKYVGLHVGRRCVMYSVFLGNCCHWQSCGKYFNSTILGLALSYKSFYLVMKLRSVNTILGLKYMI